MSRLSIGQPAPDFRTRNQHGETVQLSSLHGAPVLLVFYPFAFTAICTGELTTIQQQLPSFRARGVRVLGVSTDTMFSQRVFADQENLDFDLLTDHWPHGQIASAYGVFDPEVGCALRGSFLIDDQGLLGWQVKHSIGDPRDIEAHLAALAS